MHICAFKVALQFAVTRLFFIILYFFIHLFVSSHPKKFYDLCKKLSICLNTFLNVLLNFWLLPAVIVALRSI